MSAILPTSQSRLVARESFVPTHPADVVHMSQAIPFATQPWLPELWRYLRFAQDVCVAALVSIEDRLDVESLLVICEIDDLCRLSGRRRHFDQFVVAFILDGRSRGTFQLNPLCRIPVTDIFFNLTMLSFIRARGCGGSILGSALLLD